MRVCNGVFVIADIQTRRALSNEQHRFAIPDGTARIERIE
jgi:hypothetical protein